MEINQTLRVSGHGCAVTIEATVEDVVVRGWERDEVGLNAPEDAVSLRQEGDTIKVRPHVPGNDDLEVYVPHACTLTLNLVSGDGAVYDIEGDVKAQSMSGDVKVHDVRGTLFAQSVSGDVDVSASVLYLMSVETVSGDATIESHLDEEGEYRAHTTSGDITLRVPGDQRLTVVFHSLSGDVQTELPHETRRRGRGRTETEINGGGVPFEVLSTSGDVAIEAADLSAEPMSDAEPWSERRERVPVGGDTAPLRDAPASDEPFGLDGELVPGLSTAEQRMAILKAIETGALTVNEGLARLREL